jgi:hypothetical protein
VVNGTTFMFTIEIRITSENCWSFYSWKLHPSFLFLTFDTHVSLHSFALKKVKANEFKFKLDLSSPVSTGLKLLVIYMNPMRSAKSIVAKGIDILRVKKI